MGMVNGRALRGFDHNGHYRQGDRITVSSGVGKQLVNKGLIVLDNLPDVPNSAAGTPLSASPVAQVSPQTIATASGGGDSEPKKTRAKRKKKGV